MKCVVTPYLFMFLLRSGLNLDKTDVTAVRLAAYLQGGGQLEPSVQVQPDGKRKRKTQNPSVSRNISRLRCPLIHLLPTFLHDTRTLSSLTSLVESPSATVSTPPSINLQPLARRPSIERTRQIKAPERHGK